MNSLAITTENTVKTEPEKLGAKEVSKNNNLVNLIVYGYQVNPLKEDDTSSNYYIFFLKVYLAPNSSRLRKREWLLTNWGNEDDDLPPG